MRRFEERRESRSFLERESETGFGRGKKVRSDF